MKKSSYIFLFLGIILILGIGIFIYYKQNSNSNKTSENNNTTNNTSTEISRTSTENTTNINENLNTTQNETNTTKPQQESPSPSATPIEEEISNFSTKIYSTKDSARQNNLQITSSKLNGTTVEPGATFSFTSTVGKATPEAGYEKADIYDENGNKVKGYGGGNCQISSTLYNAVLKLPSLKVTERHPHSHKVPYVPENKDAAVAYGSVDFKFKNNYNYPIKIYCTTNKKNVNIRIVKIS